MPSIEVTGDNFNSTVEAHPIVILDFWAEWCGPCKSFAPIFEAAAGRHPDIVFGKVDTDAEQELASAFDIRSIPTLMVVREQIMVFRQSGALPASAFEQLIAEARALDMDAVRSELATQEDKA